MTVLGQLCHSVALGFREKSHENSMCLLRSRAQLCAELVDWMDPESSATLIQESLRTVQKGFEDFVVRVSELLQCLAGPLHEKGQVRLRASGSGVGARGLPGASFRARPLTARRDAVLMELLIIYMPSYQQNQLPQTTVIL